MCSMFIIISNLLNFHQDHLLARERSCERKGRCVGRSLLVAGSFYILEKSFTNRISLPSGHIPLSFWFSPSFQILAAKRCSVEQLLTSHWNKVSSTHHFSIQNCHLRNIIISLPSSNIIIMFNMILKQIIFQFQYGRNFFTRYDYEGCASAPCEQMMNNLETLVI